MDVPGGRRSRPAFPAFSKNHENRIREVALTHPLEYVFSPFSPDYYFFAEAEKSRDRAGRFAQRLHASGRREVGDRVIGAARSVVGDVRGGTGPAEESRDGSLGAVASLSARALLCREEL